MVLNRIIRETCSSSLEYHSNCLNMPVEAASLTAACAAVGTVTEETTMKRNKQKRRLEPIKKNSERLMYGGSGAEGSVCVCGRERVCVREREKEGEAKICCVNNQQEREIKVNRKELKIKTCI
jgi:hypothetical protein